MPSLGQQLSWLWLACGFGLLLMGLTSSWNDAAFMQPTSQRMHVFTGQLQKVTFSAPAKSPTLVELIVYHKKQGLKHGYLRYGVHDWEERLKPYLHQEVSLFLGKDLQVWGVEYLSHEILSAHEIERRLKAMRNKQAQIAEAFMYIGFFMVLGWLLLRKGCRRNAK